MATTKKPSKQRKDLKMDFVSMDSVKGNTIDEKLENILEDVKDGHIVVLDEALDPNEEARLVATTMENIDAKFAGIEFCSLPRKENWLYKKMNRMVSFITRSNVTTPGLTLVGPSNIIREIKRDPDSFHVSAGV